MQQSATLEGKSCGGVVFNYPAAETRGGIGATPPANKMAVVTITRFYQTAEVATHFYNEFVTRFLTQVFYINTYVSKNQLK